MQARADAVREERALTRRIAELCIDARKAGVRMGVLADAVKVLKKDGSMRPITRQGLDLMIAEVDGRERQPQPWHTGRRRKADENGHQDGGVNVNALL